MKFHWSNLLLWSTFSYLMSLLTYYFDHVLNCQNILEQNCWCQIKNSEHSTKWLFNFISYSLQHTTLLVLAALSDDAHTTFPLLIQCSLQLLFISCFVHIIFYLKLKQKMFFYFIQQNIMPNYRFLVNHYDPFHTEYFWVHNNALDD